MALPVSIFTVLILLGISVTNDAAHMDYSRPTRELKQYKQLLKALGAEDKGSGNNVNVDGKQTADSSTPTNDMDYNYAECMFVNNIDLDDETRAKNNIRGNVSLKQVKSGQGPLYIKIHLEGIDTASAKQHGFHVHQFGDLTTGCTSTGSHFNPAGKTHGGPDDIERHVGDWGNVEKGNEGKVNMTITDDLASIAGGDYYIIGRAIVLHEETDDLGKGGDQESLTTGNAGSRLACCIIGLAPNKNW